MRETIQVPHEKLQAQRQQALKRHQQRKRRNKVLTVTTSSLIIMCLAFTLSIRVSPAFANYVAKIPGFAPLVQLFEYDKGLRDVLNNGYFEEVGVAATSDEHNITVTVVGVIADYSGLAIAYTVEAPTTLRDFGMPDIQILQNGEQIPAGFSYDYSSQAGQKYLEDMIMLTTDKGMDYSSPDFELTLTYNNIDEKIVVPFTLQQEIYDPKILAQNIELELENQRLTIKSIMITPMRAILKFDVDPNNDMQILALDGLKLIDEDGEEWATIRNGLVANGSLRENNYTLYMESNYYREPESLKLSIEAVSALPKGEDYIVVDFEKQQFVKVPSLPAWELQIEANMLSISTDTGKGLELVGWGVDALQNVHLDSSYEEDDTRITQRVNVPADIPNPVRFDINYYPNYIGEEIEIEL